MPYSNSKIKKRALIDLTSRAKGGIVLYTIVWTIIGTSGQLNQNSPQFFYLNLSIFIILMIARAGHLVAVIRYPDLSSKLLTNILTWIVLVGALHWGLIVGWVSYDENCADILFLMLIVTPAFAIGGAVALSISNTIRLAYPLLMFIPGIIVLFFTDNQQDPWIGVLALFSLVYVYFTTTSVHADYWRSTRDHYAAQHRADLMKEISQTDPLTKVRNRMFFDKRYKEEWKRSSRSDSPLSILMVDLDRFKSVNDNFGHCFGDAYLKSVAATMAKEVKRDSDCLARYGGEEFVLLLPDTDAENARALAHRLLNSISRIKLKHEGQCVQITCSIGGSTLIPSHNIKEDYLLKNADKALYRAKHNGRNQYCVLNG